MHQQAQSSLFQLPAELRNEIYDLASTVKIETNTCEASVELVKAGTGVPSGSLLRTCKAINLEARDSFQRHNQAYWEKTVFTISNIQAAKLEPTLKRLRVTSFAGIRCIRFAIKDFQSVAVMDITNEGGDWRLRVHSVRPRPGVEV